MSIPSIVSPKAYAIDFGTSNSLLTGINESFVDAPLILDSYSKDPTILRSIWFCPEQDNWYFGEEALFKQANFSMDGRFFRSLKKFLPDPSFTNTNIFNRQYSLIDIIGLFLKELKKRADRHYQIDCKTVVLGRPAVFSPIAEHDQLAQNRLEAAAKLAGFTDIAFCPEPIAAGYEFRSQLSKPRTVLIADFGGGTSDYSIIRMDKNGFKSTDILSTHGISLAGDAFDSAIMEHDISPHLGSKITFKFPMGKNVMSMPNHLLHKLYSPANIAFLGRQECKSILELISRFAIESEQEVKLNQLLTLVEEHQGYYLFAKIEEHKRILSDKGETVFQFTFPGINIKQVLEQKKYENYSTELVEKIITTLDETLSQASLHYEDIEIVCLTGGTAKIPAIQKALVERFGNERVSQFKNFHSVINGLGYFAQKRIKT